MVNVPIHQVLDKGPGSQNRSLTPGPLTVKKFKLNSYIMQNFKELKRYLQGTISGELFRFIYIFYTNLLSLSYTHLIIHLQLAFINSFQNIPFVLLQ